MFLISLSIYHASYDVCMYCDIDRERSKLAVKLLIVKSCGSLPILLLAV